MIDKRDARIVETILSNTRDDCTPYRAMLHVTEIYQRSLSWRNGFADGVFLVLLDSSLSASANDYLRGHAAGACALAQYLKET